MMIVSHSVFKEQKKHQRCYLIQQASLLERRVTYANCLSRSTAFLFYFSEQFLIQFATRFTARFVLNKAGHHTHLSLFGNPFLKLFFRTIYRSILTRFAARFVSNKAGHSTRIKKPCNFFCKINSLYGKNIKKHQQTHGKM